MIYTTVGLGKNNRTAIWSCGCRAIENAKEHPRDGFTHAEIGSMYIYICYAAPKQTLEKFKLLLEKLSFDTSRYNPQIIAAWS